MTASGRIHSYRYPVNLKNALITPLASVEAHFGPQKLSVLNISQGGLALIFESGSEAKVGDFLEIAVSIRDRAFPVSVEVKGLKSKRASLAFINPSANFSTALREFLAPKYLGTCLVQSEELSNQESFLNWTPEAEKMLVFLGQNECAAFVWLGPSQKTLKLLSVRGNMVFEWTEEFGVKTGHLSVGHDLLGFSENAVDEDLPIEWDRSCQEAVVHYFSDLFLAWLSQKNGTDFVQKMTLDFKSGLPEGETLRFPNV